MKLNYGPRGILQFDDCRIIFRNFEGRGDKFNREGDRNFALVIPNQEIADELIADGWNVKVKEPREEGDEPLRYLGVKVKFNDRGPSVRLVSNGNIVMLNSDTVGMLDHIDISNVDMDIRPYDWTLQDGKSGRSAYLQAIVVHQEVDRFAERYAMEESPEE